MNHFKGMALVFVLLGAAACKKVQTDVLPEPLRFVLVDPLGHNLLTSTATPLRVSALDANGKRFYLPDPGSAAGSIVAEDSTAVFPYKFYYQNVEPALDSGQGSKDWYLELGGKTDTLHYDVQGVRVASVLFNGKPVALTSTQAGLASYYRLQRAHSR